jgi:hypothetical protein
MRQVVPHRNNIVADPDNCKSFLHKNAGSFHSFRRTVDRLVQWTGAEVVRLRKLRIRSSALQKGSSNRRGED